MVIRASSIGGIPFGDNAGRPANPSTGQPYFNGESQRLELYTGVQYGWQNIVAETPGVTGYSGTVLESNTTNTINIVGTNFASGATATLVGNDGTEYNATTTTVNNLTSLTATFGALAADKEPYDIRVTNPSNLYGVYYDILTVNDTPVWSTAAGSIGTVMANNSFSSTVSATDEENNTLSYSIVSGSLPSGITLNSSTGVISGTAPAVSSDTTYTFTVRVSDSNNTSNRVFSMIVQSANGSSSARAALSPKQLKSIGISSSGTYWFKNSGYNSGTPFQAYADMSVGDGYIILCGLSKSDDSATSWTSFGTAATSSYGTPAFRYEHYLPAANILNQWSGDSNNRFIVGQTDASGSDISSATRKNWFVLNISPSTAKNWFDDNPGTPQFNADVVDSSSGSGLANYSWSSTHGNEIWQLYRTSGGGVNSRLWMETRTGGGDTNHSPIVFSTGEGAYLKGNADNGSFPSMPSYRWLFMGFSPSNT